MSVTQSLVDGNPLWKRSGAADFYAVFDHTQAHKPLVQICYNDNTVWSGLYILEPDYTHPKIGLYPDPETNPVDPNLEIRNKLESFLLHLYGAGVFIADTEIFYDLDSDIMSAGIGSMYETVNVLDFMVLTGAKRQHYKLPDGTIKDLTTLGPGDDDIRTFLTDVENEDWQLMNDIIKHIGLKGLVPYLYASRGIDFATFAELILFFYPDTPTRKAYFATTLDPFLKSKRVPIFTQSQLQTLGII